MNKKHMIYGLLFMLAVVSAYPASALTISPANGGLNSLDHNNYYTWGINIAPNPALQITSAQLFIDNIYDWTAESNDILYVHLLDNPSYKPLGQSRQPTSKVTTGTDYEYPADAFAGQGRLLFTYTDTNGGKPTEDITYNFTAEDLKVLNSYWMNNGTNGVFGFGFDPDCHYYDDGVRFTCSFGTPPVPEPLSAVLMAIGLGGLALRRKFIA